MEVINKDMIANGHDYATFETGSKIATIGKPLPFYTDPQACVANLTTAENSFTTNTVFAKYFGEQLKIEHRWKKEVIFSSQMRKLIDSGLKEHGVFISADAEAKSNQFVSLINQLSKLKKDNLIREAKLELVDDHYVVKDFEPLVKLIKSEFIKRDMPDNVIDALGVNKDGQLLNKFDTILMSNIDPILNSIVDSRVIIQKVNGEPLIQLANTGFEKFRNGTEEEKAQYSTNDLAFYRKGWAEGENGEDLISAMKVKIALTGDYVHLLHLIGPGW